MDIIDSIDQAVGCHQCGGSLDGSASDDFCTEECQRAWSAVRVGETPEPADDWFFRPNVGDRLRIEGLGLAEVFAYNGVRWEPVGHTAASFVIGEAS